MSNRATVAMQPCADYNADVLAPALRGLLDNLGGIERFVATGQTVLLKPNLLSPRPPEHAVTTHPALVVAMARLCFEADAGAVWIGDSCAGDHSDEELWARTGMQSATRDLPVVFKSFNRAVAAHPLGDRQVPVPDWLSQVDVLISLPKLKTHGLTIFTGGVKNVYGIIAGEAKSAYHGTHPSPRSMSAFLAEVYREFTPHLTVVDAVVAMEGEGPANGRPKKLGLLLGGTDAVAVDSVCARFFGLSSEQVPLLAEAVKHGCGVGDRGRIAILGIDPAKLKGIRLRPSVARFLLRIPEPFFKLATRLTRCQPRINQKLCVGCGVCQRICSRHAIKRDGGGRLRVEPSLCIVCMCCAESCPQHAVETRLPLARLRSFCRRLIVPSGK